MSRFRVEILRKENLEWIFFEYIETNSMLEANKLAKTDFEELSGTGEYRTFRIKVDKGIECPHCLTRVYPERVKKGERIIISELRDSDIILKCLTCEKPFPSTRKELELYSH